MFKTMKSVCATMALALVAGAALAKLPALSDEAKAKAAEAKAKAAWSGKVAAFKLCKAQDKVVAHYQKAPEAKGTKGAAPATACADPGAFVYMPNVPIAPVNSALAATNNVAAVKKP